MRRHTKGLWPCWCVRFYCKSLRSIALHFRFININNAFQILCDPHSRRRYHGNFLGYSPDFLGYSHVKCLYFVEETGEANVHMTFEESSSSFKDFMNELNHLSSEYRGSQQEIDEIKSFYEKTGGSVEHIC